VIRVRVASGELTAGTLQLGGAEHHYLMRVRRARVGEAVELFDGHGAVAAANVTAIDAEVTTLQVSAVRRERAGDAAHLIAAIPLLKGERMDQCVEKLVEVGCDQLVVWEASRSVVRLEASKRAARLERWRAQVAAAVRQSGRAASPTVEGIWSLEDVLTRFVGARRIALVPGAPRLAPSRGELDARHRPRDAGLEGDDQGTAAALGAANLVLLLSGPEGGLSEQELAALTDSGFELASLTDTVLRAETAPAVAVAIWRWANG
jgi:16S rRNA (uracil1498-N3)-methyltransferase